MLCIAAVAAAEDSAKATSAKATSASSDPPPPPEDKIDCLAVGTEALRGASHDLRCDGCVERAELEALCEQKKAALRTVDDTFVWVEADAAAVECAGPDCPVRNEGAGDSGAGAGDSGDGAGDSVGESSGGLSLGRLWSSLCRLWDFTAYIGAVGTGTSEVDSVVGTGCLSVLAWLAVVYGSEKSLELGVPHPALAERIIGGPETGLARDGLLLPLFACRVVLVWCVAIPRAVGRSS